MSRLATIDSATETSTEKKEANPRPDDLVREQFKERDGWKLRIVPLWTKNGNSYFRVNYMNWENWKLFESYWVVVSNGVVNADKDVPPQKME